MEFRLSCGNVDNAIPFSFIVVVLIAILPMSVFNKRSETWFSVAKDAGMGWVIFFKGRGILNIVWAGSTME